MNEVININALIEAGVGLEHVSLHGIADPIVIHEDMEHIYPVIINADGECHDVLFDDSQDMSLYHRLNGKTYSTVQSAGYGDTPQRTVVYDMSLIVSGKRQSKNMYDVERICVQAIEGIKNANTLPTVVSTNFNRMQIFASEYAGIQFPIQPNVYLFKTNYKITRIQSPCKN